MPRGIIPKVLNATARRRKVGLVGEWRRAARDLEIDHDVGRHRCVAARPSIGRRRSCRLGTKVDRQGPLSVIHSDVDFEGRVRKQKIQFGFERHFPSERNQGVVNREVQREILVGVGVIDLQRFDIEALKTLVGTEMSENLRRRGIFAEVENDLIDAEGDAA